MIGVSAEHRGPAGVDGGDEVDIDLELDTAPREIEVPDDLAAALAASPAAQATFDKLSYSNKSLAHAPDRRRQERPRRARGASRSPSPRCARGIR